MTVCQCQMIKYWLFFTETIVYTLSGRQEKNASLYHFLYNTGWDRVHWNPFGKATPFAPEMWPFKRGYHSLRVEINTFMFILTLSSGLSRGVTTH